MNTLTPSQRAALRALRGVAPNPVKVSGSKMANYCTRAFHFYEAAVSCEDESSGVQRILKASAKEAAACMDEAIMVLSSVIVEEKVQ